MRQPIAANLTRHIQQFGDAVSVGSCFRFPPKVKKIPACTCSNFAEVLLAGYFWTGFRPAVFPLQCGLSGLFLSGTLVVPVGAPLTVCPSSDHAQICRCASALKDCNPESSTSSACRCLSRPIFSAIAEAVLCIRRASDMACWVNLCTDPTQTNIRPLMRNGEIIPAKFSRELFYPALMEKTPGLRWYWSAVMV